MKKNFLYVVTIFISICILYAVTKTQTSGYHLTDDHEIIRLVNELSINSTFSVAKKWINEDFGIRFRPLYYFHRVIEAKVFGNNFMAWSLYTSSLLIFSVLSFFLGMRKLAFSHAASLIFVLLIFIGPQMEIWWRLGPNETLGIFFLSLSFYFLKSKNNKRFIIDSILFSVFLIAASLSKESFIIVIPSFVFLKITYDKDAFSLSWIESLQKNSLLLIPLFLMVAELLFIVLYVGTNKIGYAGVEKTTALVFVQQFWKVSRAIFNNTLVGVMATYCLLFHGTIYYEAKDTKLLYKLFSRLKNPLLFAGLLLAPNILLHAKSGMFGRYFLPSTVGSAFLLAAVFEAIPEQWKRLSVSLCVFVLLISKNAVNISSEAKAFAKEGRENKMLFEAISNNSSKNSKIILVADSVNYYEWSFSLMKYAELILDRQIESKTSGTIQEPDLVISFDKNMAKDTKLVLYEDVLSPSSRYAVFVKKHK